MIYPIKSFTVTLLCDSDRTLDMEIMLSTNQHCLYALICVCATLIKIDLHVIISTLYKQHVFLHLTIKTILVRYLDFNSADSHSCR